MTHKMGPAHQLVGSRRNPATPRRRPQHHASADTLGAEEATVTSFLHTFDRRVTWDSAAALRAWWATASQGTAPSLTARSNGKVWRSSLAVGEVVFPQGPTSVRSNCCCSPTR